MIHQGDALTVLRTLPESSVHCCITSPPYWGLRDYGTATFEGGSADCDHKQEAPRFNGPKQTQAQVSGHASKAESHDRRYCARCGAIRVDQQLGLESSPAEYVDVMVEVFGEVRRVLRDDGTLWLNLGDSYAGSWGAQSRGNTTGEGKSTLEGSSMLSARQISAAPAKNPGRNPSSFRRDRPDAGGLRHKDGGLKPKDLIGIPWRVALALQADGWWLRSDIIWHKPNPMPESVTDRPTKSHEYIFLLAKSETYHYDLDAIREPLRPGTPARMLRAHAPYQAPGQVPHHGVAGERPNRNYSSGNTERQNREEHGGVAGRNQNQAFGVPWSDDGTGRNKRSVWTLATLPTPDAHFATFPIELPETCLRAGCVGGGTVLDPFAGAGTTGLACLKNGRNFVGIELNPAYIEIAHNRARKYYPLLMGSTEVAS